MTFLFSSALDDGFQIEFLQCVLCACACRGLPSSVWRRPLCSGHDCYPRLPTQIDLHMCQCPPIWETPRIYRSALRAVPQQFMALVELFIMSLWCFFTWHTSSMPWA